MIGFLKAQPGRAVAFTAAEVSSQYRYWRCHIMCMLYGGYAVLYCMRKSLNFIMPAVVAEQGINIINVGLAGTVFYTVYGCSKFISGMLSDQANPGYFMGLGVFISGIACVLLGFSQSVISFVVLLVITAWFQGWGWPPCARLLTSWYSQSERGMWWAGWNTSHNIGGGLAVLLVSYIAMNYGWRAFIVITGIAGVFTGLVLCWRLRDKPVTLGLPPVGIWRQDKLEQIQEKTEPGLVYGAALKNYVFKNQYIWLLAFSYVLVYIVRVAVSDWGNLYFTECYGYDLVSANTILFMFELGGFFGSLMAGWGSDKLFDGNRGPMNLLFAMGLFLSIVALWLMPVVSIVLQAACLFIIGFCVFGPQMLIGMAAAECSHKTAVGAATGFLGLFAYLGAALAGYPMALIIKTFHWDGFYVVLATASATISLLLLPFFQAQLPKRSLV